MNSSDVMRRLAQANPLADELQAPALDPVLRRIDDHELPLSDEDAAPRAVLTERMAHSRERGHHGGGQTPGVSSPAIPRRMLRSAVAAMAVLVTVGVVVAAVLFGPRSRPVPSSPAARPAPQAESLRSQFAILHRRQTARDKQLPLVLKNMLGEPPQKHELLPTLTHVIAELPSRGQGRVLLVVIAHGPNPAHPHNIWLLTATISPTGSGAVAASPYTGQLFPQIGQGYASGLVPDAVRRVKWVFSGRIAYPTIRGNVATAPASGRPGIGPSSVTWYDAEGRVLAHQSQPIK